MGNKIEFCLSFYKKNNQLKNSLILLTYFFYLQSLAVRLGVIEIFPPNPVFPLDDNVKPDELWQYCFGDIQFKDLCLMTGIKEIMVSISVTSILLPFSLLSCFF